MFMKESISIVEDQGGIQQFLKTEVLKSIADGKSDSFFVTDLSKVIERYELWLECFPTIRPFFCD